LKNKIHLILCPDRTGSTYLRRALTLHKNVIAPPENLQIKHAILAPRNKKIYLDEGVTWDKVEPVLHDCFRTYMDRWIDFMAEVYSKPGGIFILKQVGWVEEGWAINELCDIFNKSKFLIWKRHPFDTVLSQEKRWIKSNYFDSKNKSFKEICELSLIFWDRILEAKRQYLDKGIEVYEEKFENLHGGEETRLDLNVLNDLFEFFDVGRLENNDEALDRFLTFKFVRKRKKPEDRWEKLSNEKKEIVRNVLGNITKKLGYGVK